LANPRIISVLWDSGFQPTYSEIVNNAPAFFSELVSGPYFNLLNRYGVSKGSFAGQFTIVPSNPTTSLTPQIVADELAKDVGHSLPAADANSIYVILLQKNGLGSVTFTDDSGSVSCGYHGKFEAAGANSYTAFAVVPDFMNAPCGTGNGINQGTYRTPFGSQAIETLFVASNEVIGAAVNPYGSNPEVGAPCQNASHNGGIAFTSFMGSTRVWNVQKVWDTSTSTCLSLTLPDPLPYAESSSSFAISRAPGNIDAFRVKSDGAIYNDFFNSTGWGIKNTTGMATSTAALAVSARTPNNLDVFWIDANRALHTAYWSATKPWATRVITSAGMPPIGGNVASVSRNSSDLDVFFIGSDGHLYTSYWHGGGWGTAAITGYAVAPPGAPLAAVARTENNLDVFFIDSGGSLQQASWFLGAANWSVGSVIQDSGVTGSPKIALPGSPIAATARAWDRLDVFVTDPSGTFLWANWSDSEMPNIEGDQYITYLNNWVAHSFFPAFPVKAPLAAVTRQPDNMDVFAVGDNGAVYNMFYSDQNPSLPNLRWGQKEMTGTGFSVAGTSIAAATRGPNNLEVVEQGKSGTYFYNEWNLGKQWASKPIP
jgi:hypothetical protein